MYITINIFIDTMEYEILKVATYSYKHIFLIIYHNIRFKLNNIKKYISNIYLKMLASHNECRVMI